MKPEKYKAIRAKNYCTRCWKREEPKYMYLSVQGKLICELCFNELRHFYVVNNLDYHIKKLEKINRRFKNDMKM